jgi:M3 family oligoendopeptidase
MLTFNDYKYERPDLDRILNTVEELFDKFDQAESAEEQKDILKEYSSQRDYLNTMESLAHIRSSIDNNDEFYDKERTFFNENSPKISEITNRYHKSLTNSTFRDELEQRYGLPLSASKSAQNIVHQDELEEKFGNQLFALAENAQKVFDPELSDLYIRENRLSTEYAKLIASAEFEFDGKLLNISELNKYTEDNDRAVRKEATVKMQNFFKENLETFDQLYDDLVKTRHAIALGLGFDNFLPVAYMRMNRIDYNSALVENFRDQVKEHVVPFVTELKERQRKRIGVDTLKIYDENFTFKDGSPAIVGSTKDIMDNGAKMYKELSKETEEFFQFMSDRELFDVEAKKGKESGGYCTYIPDYESPFIFSNFNGTLGDVKVLTHEAGHAFQKYMSRDFTIPEYRNPTLESAEIHSMSMEFLTYPWMKLFFGEDTEKFKFTHMVNSLSFLPYGVAIDEFQHIVYENPDLSPKERREEWKMLEEKYLPYRDYDGIEPLESGAFWHKQMHVFRRPFYYIDYTLAQVCALQFLKRSEENFEEAWKDYVELCKLGGSLPFGSLLKSADLKSPFDIDTVKTVVADMREYLDSIDDTQL